MVITYRLVFDYFLVNIRKLMVNIFCMEFVNFSNENITGSIALIEKKIL